MINKNVYFGNVTGDFFKLNTKFDRLAHLLSLLLDSICYMFRSTREHHEVYIHNLKV
jgi:hypothetical protein